jgi:hypothetical protein
LLPFFSCAHDCSTHQNFHSFYKIVKITVPTTLISWSCPSLISLSILGQQNQHVHGSRSFTWNASARKITVGQQNNVMNEHVFQICL